MNVPLNSRGVTPNILVLHSNALISAGLVATMRRISGCEVHDKIQFRTHGLSNDPMSGIDLLVADSAALLDSAAAHCDSDPPPSAVKPQIVWLTSPSDGATATAPTPIEVNACVSMHCRQDDLLSTVCRLLGAPVLEQPRGTDMAPHGGLGALPVPRPPRGGLAPSALRRVREHIECSIGEHIELKDLAAMCRLSVCHFSRAFKESVGTPPHRYLMSRRVSIAANLIKTTDLQISEIALEVGFSDQSHFTRAFTAQLGESPRRYRHQRR